MFVIIVFISVLVFCVFICFWLTHISQTKYYTNKYGYASFSTFKKEFNKEDWCKDKNNPNSFFVSFNTEIHASIIQFKGKGMLLYPWSYLAFLFFIKRRINAEKEKIKW